MTTPYPTPAPEYASDWHPLSLVPPVGIPWGINFGGGLNSSAVIVECERRGMRPDWILFSDTGSERPETYAHIANMEKWCKARGLPFTVTRWIRKDGSFESLEDNCLRTGYMPSKAYGYSGCSFKWKVQPAQKWRKQNGFARTVYAVGFDAGEIRRVNKRKCERTNIDAEDMEEYPWYPLFAWGIDRAGCAAIVKAAGFDHIPKSACFFCPNAKKAEWYDLQREHPDLYARSLAIEAGAIAAGNARNNGLLRSGQFLKNLATAYDAEIPPEDLNCMCKD